MLLLVAALQVFVMFEYALDADEVGIVISPIFGFKESNLIEKQLINECFRNLIDKIDIFLRRFKRKYVCDKLNWAPFKNLIVLELDDVDDESSIVPHPHCNEQRMTC